uniref:hypothetical protein n=1 Tax=uncultured Erythrobacter sp. TaxID=263913 RepID=UPI002638DF69|nr:hypothetical protein [uncultured Erythrobacter sp.]
MVRVFSQSVAGAALVLSTTVMAGQSEAEPQTVDAPAEPEATTAMAKAEVLKDTPNGETVVRSRTVAISDMKPVKLVEFDGEFEVLKTSRRLRVWRSHLAYTIKVDADGKPTGCELTDGFRRTYVKKKLCDVLVKHHTFEPARDESDAPVEGTYTARLSYMDMRNAQ